MTKSKIYLDCCCFNRPYDKQKQLRISLETQAKVDIQHRIANDDLYLVVSTMLFLENSRNKNHEARSYIDHFMLGHGSVLVISDTQKVKDIRDEIMLTGIKSADATHLASAIYSHCDYFITTDDRLLKYRTDDIEVINPVQFITEDR